MANKRILLGNEAIVMGALKAGVDFVSGYPGCPSAEVGEEFVKISKQAGVYTEWSTNEKIALEAAIGASFSGLKSLVNMKSFGINVCSDSLFPLAYTGTRAPMVIYLADDPSCHSSAQSEQDSRGYAYLSHLPFLEASTPQECYEFTKIGFQLSEKFNIPVILRITTRVAHQRAPVSFEVTGDREFKKGEFVKNPNQFCTMPPHVLDMKKELLGKLEKIKVFVEKSKVNEITGKNSKLGIITSGASYLYVKEALCELNLNVSVLKLGFFYPLPEKLISNFLKSKKSIFVVEEMDPYLEKEIVQISKDINPKIKVFGKNILSRTGELNTERVKMAVAQILGKKIKSLKINKIEIPKRYPRLCEGCPYWHIFPALKKILSGSQFTLENTIFGGDIGCNMMAGLPPHNIQDYLFSMGASMGISHGVRKSTNQKVISIIGDGTFFHGGVSGLINAVYNKSNFLIIVLDNRITAMTGHQPNPGMGKTAMGEDSEEVKIEDIAKASGVKNVKVLDPINSEEFEQTVKDFLPREDVSMIICRRVCALLDKRQKGEAGE